jgi:ribonuclease HI
MGKEKNNYYVVWKGARPGVYASWADCQKQIHGYPNAKYKGFKTHEAAIKAFSETHEKYWGKNSPAKKLSDHEITRIGKPILNSISVDAAWNTSTLEMEYQGVKTETKELVFQRGPFQQGTNNVGEFLAIVHALALLKKNNIPIPVYSDSRNAINWVKNKKHKSLLVRTQKNEELFELLDKAERWLQTNTYPNKILKWETKAWGENPADFGRK